MANLVPITYKSAVIAQTSATIAAAAFSTGTLTLLDNSLTGNGGGACLYRCFINLTTAPSTNSSLTVHMASIYTGTPTIYDNGVLSIAVPSGTSYIGVFPIGDIWYPDKYVYLKLKAGSNAGMAASLIVVPVIAEIQ